MGEFLPKLISEKKKWGLRKLENYGFHETNKSLGYFSLEAATHGGEVWNHKSGFLLQGGPPTSHKWSYNSTYRGYNML